MNRTSPLLAAGFFLFGIHSLSAAPYVDWMNDYTGDEANTIALWKFDTAGVGVAGNSYAGGVYPTTALTFAANGIKTGVGGKFGEALFLSSSTAQADHNWAYSGTYTGTLQPLFNASAMSVEFWFKPVELTLSSSSSGYLFDQKYTSANGMSFVFGANHNLIFRVGNGNSETTAEATTEALSWNAEQWYHLAVTFENVAGDGVLKIYRDGVLVGSTVSEGFGDAAPGTRRYRIGNRGSSNYAPTPGYYDNFRISSVAYEYEAIPEPQVAMQWGLGASLLIMLTFHTRRSTRASL